MYAAGQAPIWVAGENFQAFMDVLRLAGLRLKIDIFRTIFLDDILPKCLPHDVFKLRYAAQAGGDGRSLGRYRPVFDEFVEFFRRIERAAGFDVNSITVIDEGPTQRCNVLSKRLSSGQADPGRGMVVYFLKNLLDGHLGEGVKFRVAKEAAQMALCESDKGGRLAHTQAFSLDRVEDLVDFQRLAGVTPVGEEGERGGWDEIRHDRKFRVSSDE